MIEILETTRLADGKYHIVLSIDGTQKEYDVTNINQLKDLLKADVLEMPNADEIIANTDTKALFDEIVQTEKNRQAYVKNVALLEELTHLIELGVFTGDETQIVNLRNKIKNEFDVDYVT